MTNEKKKLFIIIIIIATSLSCLFFYYVQQQSQLQEEKHKTEMISSEQQKKNNEKLANFYGEDKNILQPYRIIKDINSNKYLLVFGKLMSDFSNKEYDYILDDKKIDLYLDNEHMTVLLVETDKDLSKSFNMFVVNKKTHHENKFNFDSTETPIIIYDFSKIKQENLAAHEQLEHKIIMKKAIIQDFENRNKEATKEIKKLDKIKITSKEDEKIISDVKLELTTAIDEYTSKIRLTNEELQQLLNDNDALESQFDYLFGELHHH